MPRYGEFAEARRQRELGAGLVAERFPRVRKIALEVEFDDSNGRRVQKVRRLLSPDSYALFDIKCPVDESWFQLEQIVTKMVKSRSKQLSSGTQCTGAEDGSEHSARYSIKITYLTNRKNAGS